MRIAAPAEAIAEMERNMRLNEDIIRYLTIKVEALETEPSAMMQSRSREGRNERRVSEEEHDTADISNNSDQNDA